MCLICYGMVWLCCVVVCCGVVFVLCCHVLWLFCFLVFIRALV